MRKEYALKIEIPEGVSCEFSDRVFKCAKDGQTNERKISIPGTEIHIEKNTIAFSCKKANKKNIAMIKTNASHIRNLIKGFEEKFVYEMEICNVHFPITAKIEGNRVLISNFLGEKISRSAKILPGVEVEIKGQKITVSSSDVEKAGQTAANIEKASKVSRKDRRVFQDGIFITSKPGGEI